MKESTESTEVFAKYAKLKGTITHTYYLHDINEHGNQLGA